MPYACHLLQLFLAPKYPAGILDDMRVWWMAVAIPLVAAVWLCGGTLAGILALVLAAVCWLALRAPRAAPAGDPMQTALTQILCSDAIEPMKVSLQPDMTCAAALQHMIESGMQALPVTVGHRFLGLLQLNDFAKLHDRELGYAYVGAIMTHAHDFPSLSPTCTAWEAMMRLRESGYAHLPVLKESALAGIVTRDSLEHALDASQGRHTSRRRNETAKRLASR